MNRNKYHDFRSAPTSLDIQRSRVAIDYKNKTTFNVGSLVPVMAREILPGETVSLDTSFVMRMSTPVKPVMDNLYLDIFYFFVPNRIIWDEFEEFMGENKEGAWAQTKEIQVPHINAPVSDGFYEKSLADYLAIPTKVANISFNALFARAYWLTWNEWFRDQNLQAPIYFTKDSQDWVADNLVDFAPATAMDSLALAPANKFHDYFTSALPDPQKGPDVTIPFEGSIDLSNPEYNLSLGYKNLVNPGVYETVPFDVKIGGVGSNSTGTNTTYLGKGVLVVLKMKYLD